MFFFFIGDYGGDCSQVVFRVIGHGVNGDIMETGLVLFLLNCIFMYKFPYNIKEYSRNVEK